MKLQDNQAGFSGLAIGIVVIVLGLVGAAGWLVYDRQHDKANSSAKDTPKAITSFEECVAAGNPVMESYPEQCAAGGKTFVNEKQKNTPANTDETTNWLLYTAKGNAFTVRVADGWVVEDGYYGQGFNTFSNENLAPKAGTKAVVHPYPGGKDGRSGFFLNYATQNIDQIVTPGQKQASLKTKDGLEIEKYYWVVSGYSNEGLGTQNGDTEYTYVIRQSASRVITASYSFQPGSKDYHQTVEKVLTTIHFN